MRYFRFILSILAISLFLGTIPSRVHAATCQFNSSTFVPDGNRNVQICVGGFASAAALRQNTVDFICRDNSSQFSGTCIGNTVMTQNLSSVPDSQIAQSADGYYTCIEGQQLHRGIGVLDVVVKDSGSNRAVCTVLNLNTRPTDYTVWREGWPMSPQLVDNNLCRFAQSQQGACNQCMSVKGNIWTAIGCIETVTPGAFVKNLLALGIGMAGGIAFLLVLFGGFQILTSAGNPDQLTAGQELISAAITGLLLIIFSVFILRIIGVNILNLPGFMAS